MDQGLIDALKEAERLYCDELWSIMDDGLLIMKDGVTRTVSPEVMLAMRGIRVGMGCRRPVFDWFGTH